MYDEKLQERESKFTCSICFSVLLDPHQCDTCCTIFCKTCIHNQNKFIDCPIKCPKKKYSEISRHIKKDLMTMRFFCPNYMCEFSKGNQEKLVKQTKFPMEVGMPYLKAQDHRKTCLFVKHYCEFGCGERIMGCDLDAHKT